MPHGKQALGVGVGMWAWYGAKRQTFLPFDGLIFGGSRAGRMGGGTPPLGVLKEA